MDDWFGNPLTRDPDPVACPRCGTPFTDRDAFVEHLASDHDVSPPASASRRRPAPVRRDVPALGRNARSPLAIWLRRTPLALVVVLNVALILVTFAALGAIEPAWWVALRSEAWADVVVVPMLWPTILFLLLRGID